MAATSAIAANEVVPLPGVHKFHQFEYKTVEDHDESHRRIEEARRMHDHPGSCAANSGELTELAPVVPGTKLASMDGTFVGQPIRPLLEQIEEQGALGPLDEPVGLLFVMEKDYETYENDAFTNAMTDDLSLPEIFALSDGYAALPDGTAFVSQAGAFAEPGSLTKKVLVPPSLEQNRTIGVFQILGSFAKSLPPALAARTFDMIMIVSYNELLPKALSESTADKFRALPQLLPVRNGAAPYIDVYDYIYDLMLSDPVRDALQAVL